MDRSSIYDQHLLLDCMLEMGELLLDCGAEISRVEDTLERVGKAYGANRVDVFVIPSLISITLNFPVTIPVTETRRISSTGGTDFYRLEKLNGLSRECCREPLKLEELRGRLDRVAAGHKPFSVVLLGSILGASTRSVGDLAYGYILLEIPGGPAELAKAVTYLSSMPDVIVQVEAEYGSKEVKA